MFCNEYYEIMEGEKWDYLTIRPLWWNMTIATIDIGWTGIAFTNWLWWKILDETKYTDTETRRFTDPADQLAGERL